MTSRSKSGSTPPRYVITDPNSIARSGGRLDASYWVQTARGKRPYVVKGFQLVQARGAELKYAVYLRPKAAHRIQNMGISNQEQLIEEIEKLLSQESP